jgi:hypothetical protein
VSTPEKRALHLVQEYSRFQRAINECRQRIGKLLEECRGDGGVGGIGDEVGTHIGAWLANPDHYDNDAPSKTECPHCHAAYLSMKERQQLRRRLAAIKSAISKLGGKS